MYMQEEQITRALEANRYGREPGGRVDMHFVVRLLMNRDRGISEVIGYLSYKEGIGESLFAGTPSERTAYFTLRIEGLTAITLQNTGNTQVQVRPAGALLNIYQKENPDQDWNRPESFSDGKLVATYYEGVAQLINMGPVAESTATFDLTFNEDFYFRGKRYNFGRHAVEAVTAVSYFNSTPVETRISTFPIALTGAGVTYRVTREPSSPEVGVSQGLEGSFVDSITQPDRKLKALFTFVRGGGLVGNTFTRDGKLAILHGAWVRTGEHEFALTFVSLGLEDAVTFIRLKVKASIKLSESCDSYKGTGQMDYFDQRGRLLRSAKAPVSGERIRPETVEEQ